MKKNFLVTTGLVDSWEFNENNFLLGGWCEFYNFNDFDSAKFDNKILNEVNITKRPHHWGNIEKKIKDYEYIKIKLEDLLEIISSALSEVHTINEKKEYWRVIIYNWLNIYTTTIYERWESIRLFFEENRNINFYTNYTEVENLNFIPKDHDGFVENTQKDEWNHLIFLRLLKFLNIANLKLLKKDININNFKKEFNRNDLIQISRVSKNFPLKNHFFKIIDNIISKFAFKFNKIIFESFYFPKKEYFQICLRCKLIPSKYNNFFNFSVKDNIFLQKNKREKFKKILSNKNTDDEFIKFLLSSIYKDIPSSYLENYDLIKEKILPYSKQKKVILSMHSLFNNDNFKIYIAETKKVGSKYIHTEHGGGLTPKITPYMDYFEKVSDKVIQWKKSKDKKKIFVNLSPTKPIVKTKKIRKGDNCTIVFCEASKYIMKFKADLDLDQSIHSFHELTQLIKKLNPDIKEKVKFRTKGNFSFESEKKFTKIFGKKHIDKISVSNTFEKAIFNSKLVIIAYPQTTFCESIYSNTPTILILRENHWKLSEEAQNIFNELKKNKIIFYDINEAKDHINNHWSNLDLWWNSEEVQSIRKKFLTSYFNVKSNWHKEWSDYIYSMDFKK